MDETSHDENRERRAYPTSESEQDMKPGLTTQEVFVQVQEHGQSKSLTNKDQRKLRQKLKAMEFCQ
eukprot:5426949-Amphidinium_carterae.1